MCTFTYLPLSEGFVVTHNRDEAVFRQSWQPACWQTPYGVAKYSREGHGAGTWMGCRTDGWVVGLLNGAKVPHERTPPYPYSRGLIITRMLEGKNPYQTLQAMNLQGLEPFTLLIVHESQRIEGWWNGETWEEQTLPNLPFIRASVPLYSPEQQALRVHWFQSYLEKQIPSPGSIWDFHHQSHSEEKANDLVMERLGILKTISVTQANWDNKDMAFAFHDLLMSPSRIFLL